MKKNFTIVANWKMYLSYTQMQQWVQTNKQALEHLAQHHELIICPSYEALAFVKQTTAHTNIYLGAQDCSPYKAGAYTGQVSAQSLADIGCSFCLIGHSEAHAYQAHQPIAEKLQQALVANLQPIIIVGSNQTITKRIWSSIEQQLASLIPIIKEHQETLQTIYIAYEPLWAIGSGNVPTAQEISTIFAAIQQYTASLSLPLTLLYGGSVNTATMQSLTSIELLGGFLIGAASLDIKQLQQLAITFSVY